VPFCPHGTREVCPDGLRCKNVHFERALRPHTEIMLGDCSYLNTCHRMDTCRYVHWVLEDPGVGEEGVVGLKPAKKAEEDKASFQEVDSVQEVEAVELNRES
jgi:mRNA (2'-O-methyladenosine-N6-)-methyltransferase